MFDVKKILSRSLHIVWNYRVLWIFGFFLAMTAGGGSPGNTSNYSFSSDENPRQVFQTPDDWEGLQGDTFAEVVTDGMRQVRFAFQMLQEQYPVEYRMGISVAITAIVMAFVLGIVFAVIRYVSETATIRMVDEFEDTGVKVGFRQAWKYGWTRNAWRLFGVNFVIHLPVLGLLVLLGLVTWRILGAVWGGVEATIISTAIAGSGLAFLGIFVTVIVMAVLYVVRDLGWRMIVLDGAGAMESLGMAWALIKRQWKNVGLMWLVMVGLKIAWSLVFLVLIFPLLALSIVTSIGGIAAALIPGLLTAGIASLFAVPEYWPWIFAAVISLPIFGVVAFSPVLLVAGLGEIYNSSVWTLTYRELKAVEAVAAGEPLPLPEQETGSGE